MLVFGRDPVEWLRMHNQILSQTRSLVTNICGAPTYSKLEGQYWINRWCKNMKESNRNFFEDKLQFLRSRSKCCRTPTFCWTFNMLFKQKRNSQDVSKGRVAHLGIFRCISRCDTLDIQIPSNSCTKRDTGKHRCFNHPNDPNGIFEDLIHQRYEWTGQFNIFRQFEDSPLPFFRGKNRPLTPSPPPFGRPERCLALTPHVAFGNTRLLRLQVAEGWRSGRKMWEVDATDVVRNELFAE